MNRRSETILREVADWSRGLAPEAQYYWRCHEPRYRYLAGMLEELAGSREFRRILDVGMGFETLLLSRLFPQSRVDCLGVYEDERYRPERAFTFHAVDLNDLGVPGRVGDAEGEPYDLIVFMEVLEHLVTPPEIVLAHLASRLADGGIIVVTTPNAAWLKNRIKMLCGKNPFETLRADRKNMGHVREYTRLELERALRTAGLELIRFERRGLYRFNNVKDAIYSRLADWTHPSLRRTLVAVGQKPSAAA
jgi:SAM-dependent methyltransferase